MALKRRLTLLCLFAALVCAAMFVRELSRQNAVRYYNEAVADGQFDVAADLGGDHGLFAQAYADQQQGLFQEARLLYTGLEDADDSAVRTAALFNMGNTYLQQASSIDMDADADLASPLIELAKGSYRQVLQIDSDHWGAKYNLEAALQLLPDSKDERIVEIEGRRNTVRTVISPDPEDNLP